jgi:hypothetical protein
MTDEEMAEEYADNYDIMNKDLSPKSPRHIVTEVFLAGLKAGKPKWHKVADGDLPKDENDVLVYSGEDWRMCVGRYSPKYKAWETGCDTIAWCEIPKYTEE